MKLSLSRTAVAAAVPILALGLTSCGQISWHRSGASPSDKVTVTKTVEAPTDTTTTAAPSTSETPEQIPPNGSGAYTAVAPSGFQLNPPTSVASYSFSVPSRNIACFVGTEFICEIHDGPNDSPADSRCGFYDGDSEVRVRIVGWFKYDRPPCSTILQGVWRDPGPVLNYGESVHFSVPGAEFSCYSTTEALFCTGPENYGFKLSRTEFSRQQLG
ncbi:hypothetical protein HUN08_09310 [Gordonia sp. X0973]|uniref:hypothetical protein n=1 Tax=Gordonia sp. X0973 TaxID=2742602 RepID=UPI000F54B31E|nr:hypothetical protein [Gordonia sp. X0973]QKT07367.1 hypothetical protein HUN08_09310 [Gordonia sp. X0973]